MVEEIKKKITEVLPNATVIVANPMEDNVHFEAIVISDSFEGKSLIQQHQVVMKSLNRAFETTVHALTLKTFTPTAWELKKTEYNTEKYL